MEKFFCTRCEKKFEPEVLSVRFPSGGGIDYLCPEDTVTFDNTK